MEHSTEKRPNLLLIMCDQMRGDCMGIAGHPDVKTPYLDSLAAEGTWFPHAYSACPSCIAARAALFTGQSQERHGRVGYEDGIEWNYPHMLPGELGRGGYHTEAVGKLHVHPPLRRCGFHNLQLHDGYIGYYRKPEIPHWQNPAVSDSYLEWLRDRQGRTSDVNDTGLECNSWIARPWIYDEMSHPTNWVVSESIRFLEKRDRNEPFFLMSSFVRPHPPLDAPRDYFDLYRRMNLRSPAMGDWADLARVDRDGILYDSTRGCRDAALRREAMEGYYACITHMDHQIGRLLQALYRENLLEDTVILFISDHGEMLFDHGLFRKAQPYEGSVKIPLLVRVGRNLRGGREQVRRCDELVELRDLAPTLLEAAGLPVPDAMDGSSFWEALFEAGAGGREWLHGEHSFGEDSNHFIVTATDKFVWFSRSGREQYFALESDPREERDLIGDPGSAARIGELRALLVRTLSGREEGYSDGIRLIPGKAPVNVLSHPEWPEQTEAGGEQP